MLYSVPAYIAFSSNFIASSISPRYRYLEHNLRHLLLVQVGAGRSYEDKATSGTVDKEVNREGELIHLVYIYRYA